MARTPIHPGEILSDELDEIGLTLAGVIEVPPNRLYQILASGTSPRTRRYVSAATSTRQPISG